MSSIPKPPPLEREPAGMPFLRRWIIWDPIPDWLDLKRDVLNQIFVIALDAEKEHLAIEQRKIDQVRTLFSGKGLK